MAAERVWELYAGSEFLTPGARETLDLISQHAPPAEGMRVLDVAYGTGAGACLIAERHRCSVVGVDPHPMAAAVAKVAAARGLGAWTAFICGDGARLPVRDGAFDLAMCIGAPSIVGTEACIRGMRRALRPGGGIGVSDWVWASDDVPGEAIPEGYDIEPLTLDGYCDLMRSAGFELMYAEALPWAVWEAYYAPLRIRLDEMRAKYPGEPDGSIGSELAVVESGLAEKYWRYAVVIGRAV